MNLTLDLRTVPVANQRSLIFTSFDALAPGEALEIVDDHDPMLLYFRLDRLHGGQFSWHYVLTGPDRWQVRIERLGGQGSSAAPP